MCDNCIDKFMEQWKGVTFIDISLQTNCIQLYSFYSGSYFSEFFTENEFKERLSLITSPNCSKLLEKDLGNFIWPYSLSFDAKDYYDDIKEISKITACTPSLLLLNPFAHETLVLIKELIRYLRINQLIQMFTEAGKLNFQIRY